MRGFRRTAGARGPGAPRRRRSLVPYLGGIVVLQTGALLGVHGSYLFNEHHPTRYRDDQGALARSRQRSIDPSKEPQPGRPAPGMELYDTDGRRLGARDLRGGRVALVFTSAGAG